MENGEYVPGSLWFYAPNKGAPIAMSIIYLCSGIYHGYQSYKYHSWRMTWLYTWSATLFIAGAILREYGAYHYDNIDIFIASTVLLYAGPPLYELGNYIVLSRLLHYIPHHSSLHPDRILHFFLGLSAVVEALTGNGAAYAANSANTPDQQATGRALLKATLILQLAILFCFVGLTARFQYNCHKTEILKNNNGSANVGPILTTLYISSALILTRTVYRTVEYFIIAGVSFGESIDTVSVVIRYEWLFWVFEVAVMTANTLLLNIRHPGKYLPRDRKVFLNMRGEEKRGKEFKDERNLLRKILDPFDFYGIVAREDREWWLEDGDLEGVVGRGKGDVEKGTK